MTNDGNTSQNQRNLGPVVRRPARPTVPDNLFTLTENADVRAELEAKSTEPRRIPITGTVRLPEPERPIPEPTPKYRQLIDMLAEQYGAMPESVRLRALAKLTEVDQVLGRAVVERLNRMQQPARGKRGGRKARREEQSAARRAQQGEVQLIRLDADSGLYAQIQYAGADERPEQHDHKVLAYYRLDEIPAADMAAYSTTEYTVLLPARALVKSLRWVRRDAHVQLAAVLVTPTGVMEATNRTIEVVERGQKVPCAMAYMGPVECPRDADWPGDWHGFVSRQ